MTLKTSRGDHKAFVTIKRDECTLCGLCVQVCKGDILHLVDTEISIKPEQLFGCIACGHCAAVCPQHCISVEGRGLAKDSLLALPDKENVASYEALRNLMLIRRSVREFRNREVESEVIDKILDAAAMAPMGIPPSEVEVLVLKGKETVREFSQDMLNYIKSSRWLFQSPVKWLWRITGKESYEMIDTFINPLIDFLNVKKACGEDWLLYDAPLAMLFHAAPYADPVDPYIPAVYAMLAAESLGLGTCMIGSIAPMLKYSKSLKLKYNIRPENQLGIVVVFGYPAFKYKQAIKREFADIYYY